jgi:arylsulfatase A-like enzyme
MAKKPNLIVILIDDLRFDETSASDHPYMKTPTSTALLTRARCSRTHSTLRRCARRTAPRS